MSFELRHRVISSILNSDIWSEPTSAVPKDTVLPGFFHQAIGLPVSYILAKL